MPVVLLGGLAQVCILNCECPALALTTCRFSISYHLSRSAQDPITSRNVLYWLVHMMTYRLT